jgi:hypothetical protein
MGFPQLGSSWKWVRHTIIVLVIAGIPSLMSISVSSSLVLLFMEGPFWRYSSGSVYPGLWLTFYPPSLLLFAIISFPSYFLLFIKGHISNSKPIFKYSIVMAALTAIAGYSVFPLWQYISSVAPDVLYGIWLHLGWSASLVLIFLILIPSIDWELNRYIANGKATVSSDQQSVSALGACNPQRLGRFLLFIAFFAPYAYQRFGAESVYFGSIFYDVSLGGLSDGVLLFFIGYPILAVLFSTAATALRLFFAFKVLAYIIGREQDRTVVVVGLLSLISDTIFMPRFFVQFSYVIGPFPLLFVTGLLIMYKCFIQKQSPTS